MTAPETGSTQEQDSTLRGVILGAAMIPALVAGACFAFPYSICLRWSRQRRELALRLQMKSQGRLIPWQELERRMEESGGTCIEERFSPRGPVRYWWTPEDVYKESPHKITGWFSMRKGREYEPFIHWCRRRYTAAEGGSALLADTGLTPQSQIYALWAKCRSEAAKARWIETAPPEIVPHKPDW